MTTYFTAIVTGGTRGIGLAIAEHLVRRKASVALTYSSDDQAAEFAKDKLLSIAVENQKIMLTKGDASDPETVTKQYKHISSEFGPANVLVNNAGIMRAKSFEEIAIEEWDETIRKNLSSAFYWSRAAIPAMKNMGFGRIVNISSIAARGGGVVGPHYAASKAGMLGLTRYAARELGKIGVTVNAIAPAFIENAGIFKGLTDDREAELLGKILVPRIGRVEDVVLAFEYLLDSNFVTGVTLDVNGGAFMI